MPSLAQQLPEFAVEAIRVQRLLDDAWAHSVTRLHRGFEKSGLSAIPLARALEVQVRPPRLVVGEVKLTLRSDVVRTTKREGSLEFLPLHLGYRAAFGISRQAHCQLDLELRQVPASPPDATTPSPESSISAP